MADELPSAIDGRSVFEWSLDLRDPLSAEKRDRAVAALVHGGAATARAVIQDADPASGDAVAEAHQAVLAGIGEAAVGPLMERIDLPEAGTAFLVVALAAVGAPAAPALMRAAQDRDRSWVGRIRCLGALAAMRPQPEGVNELLVRTMYAAAEPEPVRVAAAVGIASWARSWVEADPVGAALLAGCATADDRIRDASDMAARAVRVAAAAEAAAVRDPAGIRGAVPAPGAAECAGGGVLAGELAGGVGEPSAAVPAGWRARRHEDGPLLDLEYYDGERWSGVVAASARSAGDVLDLLAHEELLDALGVRLADAVHDASTVVRIEHDDDQAQAAGYRVVEPRRAEAAAAAQRLRDLGDALRATRGVAVVDELVEVLTGISGRAYAERARGLLRGGWSSAEL